jgi:hypothetical protein
MSVRKIALVVALWVVSLFAVGTLVRAQVLTSPNKFPEPKVISGADFGMRVESQQNGVLLGPLVVRVNGQWVEAQIAPGNVVHPAR